jgi:flagellar hook-basal body complex protein FliE
MPVDAITAVGPEWNIALPEAPAQADAPAQAGSGSGFGGALTKSIGDLQGLQDEAASQSQALATGQAQDASQVVMAVERAQLSMQLAAQLRDKSLEAFHDVFRTQV